MTMSKTELQRGLQQAVATRDEIMAERNRLDDILAPVRAREEMIKGRILASYPRQRQGHGLKHNPEGNLQRYPLWHELTAIAEKWGKVKNARRAVEQRRKAVQRDIDTLGKQLIAKRRGK